MTTWTPIIAKDKLTPDAGVCALVNGKQVAIFFDRKTDQLFAIDNYCPASKANVLSRGLITSVKDILTVSSPLYKEHFSLTTGECLEDDTLSVPVYAVRITDGMVEVTA
ncbi:nitrite reductase small subunit NirD [Moritella viscosa]|uniref:Nitrite reductase (NAD(P)H), small subunit n=1 Tax=Moritella viscosa TaxID=80854 RepID=A0ABY1HCZ1_9GAMM|nr:nitrite reductase small subunit NirD [Moritella viscosa]CED62002.1 nitrite reductase (NAD(P)H) small subunit [Moritella viscosa]SGY91806.1 Nitrite reductase (NAD(P)H), small subunit [Moritella viscosa]SGY96147.1 Nitrite reductase (NAD(P)H), small subunit [Moritella viscosa]SGZ02100.1 Nitrite reductase (NAD(P)H), small subunit [Moritella viscosa]SHO07904.1 Nitrite reductase (NAD(P)H), small subunit [Moritella viscosa]